MIRPLVAAFVMLMMTLRSDLAVADGRRVALVVGVGGYESVPKLPNAVNDANAIAEMLRKAGFELVTARTDVGNLEFKRAIREFEDSAVDSDIALVFFAGHGIQIQRTNFLIPADAKLLNERDAEDEAISVDRILTALEPAKRLRLVILDACRDNPFGAKMKRRVASRAITAGLGRIEPGQTDTLIAYAAAEGFVANDGETQHSPFTTALLASLTVPGLDVRLAFGRVRDDVLKATNRKQEPHVYGSLGGGTIALVPAKLEMTPAALSDQSKNDIAKSDYEIVERVGKKEAWEVFLNTHKTGFYADLAKVQMSKLAAGGRQATLNAPVLDGSRAVESDAQTTPAIDLSPVLPAPKPSPVEQRAWDRLRRSTDPEALRKFLQTYPNSPLLTEVQSRIETLQREARERAEVQSREREAARQREEDARLKKAAEAERKRLDQVAAKQREEVEQAKLKEAERLKAEALASARQKEAEERARAAEIAARKREEEEAARLAAINARKQEAEQRAKILAAERAQAEAEAAARKREADAAKAAAEAARIAREGEERARAQAAREEADRQRIAEAQAKAAAQAEAQALALAAARAQAVADAAARQRETDAAKAAAETARIAREAEDRARAQAAQEQADRLRAVEAQAKAIVQAEAEALAKAREVEARERKKVEEIAKRQKEAEERSRAADVARRKAEQEARAAERTDAEKAHLVEAARQKAKQEALVEQRRAQAAAEAAAERKLERAAAARRREAAEAAREAAEEAAAANRRRSAEIARRAAERQAERAAAAVAQRRRAAHQAKEVSRERMSHARPAPSYRQRPEARVESSPAPRSSGGATMVGIGF